jgi:hypothetical protein
MDPADREFGSPIASDVFDGAAILVDLRSGADHGADGVGAPMWGGVEFSAQRC